MIINQYNQQDDDTANFLNKINNGTEGADHIKGFILASELQVSDVDVAYYLPEIISEITLTSSFDYEPYCFNKDPDVV